jgi:hypothetical protein
VLAAATLSGIGPCNVISTFGHRLGRAWRETDEADTDCATLLRMEGQYSNPVRVVSFNTAEGCSSDVSEEIAIELSQRCAERGEVPEQLASFIGRYGELPAIQLVLNRISGFGFGW